MSKGKKLDILVISKDDTFIKRAMDCSAEFLYSIDKVNSVDDLMTDDADFSQASVLLLDATFTDSQSEVVGQVQVVRQVAAESYIIVVVGGKMTPQNTEFVKKSGANLVAMNNEYLYSSKLEYVTAQRISSAYFPIKADDVATGSVIPCSIYHILPLNRKYLPVIIGGSEVTEAKAKKLAEIGEIYIRRDETDKYDKYAETINDKSAKGLTRRCRAKYLNLVGSFSDLVLLLTDQSEHASFEKGKELLAKCARLADDLLMSLAAIGEPWAVINNSAVGSASPVDRAPAIASYAGLLSLQSSIGNSTDVMIAAMLCDIGMLELSPGCGRKLRANNIAGFNSEERVEYEQHPIKSLNLALSRKLQVKEDMKNIILCTHERADGKGFPNKVPGAKVPAESQLIQFSERVDLATKIEMGKERVNVIEKRKEIFESEFSKANLLSFDMMSKIKPFVS